MTATNPNTAARDYTIQFLYQCECEKLYYFSPSHFDDFVANFGVGGGALDYFSALAQGVLGDIARLDNIVSENSKNWKISRMAITDRVVLRLATFELLESLAPRKVILNEAIDLAKKYGTEHSGSFVNGVLDAISGQLGAVKG